MKFNSNISSSDSKITEMIKDKERKNKQMIQNDLSDLYQKAIELYSRIDKEKFNQYVQKFIQFCISLSFNRLTLRVSASVNLVKYIHAIKIE